MKIVIFGLSISCSWGNGHATLWRALCTELIRAGHDIVFFERDLPFYRPHRDLDQLEGGRLLLYSDWRSALAAARCQLAEADAGIITSYCPDALLATDLLLDSVVPVRVFYDLDSPVTLARLAANEPVDYVGPEGYAGFDLVLSYAGGSALEAISRRLGARRVEPLYGSVDPSRHGPGQFNEKLSADLSYLGTYSKDRQDRLDAFLLEPARRLPHLRFLIGGAQYPQDFPWRPNVFFMGHVAQKQHPDFFTSSRLTLNITRAAMAAFGWCPSGRLFEAAACGVPILSDWWPGLDDFFTPGEEILVAHTPDDACAAIATSQAELARIADAARARVLAEHTAAHRARQLVAALESVGGAPQAFAAPLSQRGLM
jgi:spore maturation protein CgeB